MVIYHVIGSWFTTFWSTWDISISESGSLSIMHHVLDCRGTIVKKFWFSALDFPTIEWNGTKLITTWVGALLFTDLPWNCTILIIKGVGAHSLTTSRLYYAVHWSLWESFNFLAWPVGCGTRNRGGNLIVVYNNYRRIIGLWHFRRITVFPLCSHTPFRARVFANKIGLV